MPGEAKADGTTRILGLWDQRSFRQVSVQRYSLAMRAVRAGWNALMPRLAPLLASRGGEVDTNIPNYIQEVTRRVARQVLTAGGKNQRVLDGGPGNHSVFTGHLLEGLTAGRADTNGDGFITFAELVSYVVPRATNRYQTPAAASLPGHGLGEFVFRVNAAAAPPAGPADNG